MFLHKTERSMTNSSCYSCARCSTRNSCNEQRGEKLTARPSSRASYSRSCNPYYMYFYVEAWGKKYLSGCPVW